MSDLLREAKEKLERVKNKSGGLPYVAAPESRDPIDTASTVLPAMLNQTFRNTVTNGIPATGELLATAGAVPRWALGSESFDDAYASERTKWPASRLLEMGGPDPIDLRAGLRANTATVGGLFGDAGQRQKDVAGELFSKELLREEKEPLKTSVGEIGGDILTMWGLRLPGGKARVSKRAADRARMSTGAELGNTVEREFKSLWKDVKSQAGPGVKNVAETAAETAALAAMNGQDPMTAALVGAGFQGVASPVLFAGSQAYKRNILGVVAGLGLGFSVFERVVPGGRPDSVEWNIEQVVDKNAKLIQLGAIASLTGLRRPATGPLAKRMPDVANAVNVTLRTGVANQVALALASEKKAGNENFIRASKILSNDPMAFGQVVANRIDRSLKNNTFQKTMNDLLKTNAFQRRLRIYERDHAETPVQ